jgi:hypothetical protein
MTPVISGTKILFLAYPYYFFDEQPFAVGTAYIPAEDCVDKH